MLCLMAVPCLSQNTAKPEREMNTSSDPLNIDWAWRPASYFWAEDLGIKLSSSIKGAERRRLYERGLVDGSALPAFLAEDALSFEDRQRWGALHPQHLGGEFLPDRRAREVEIARIVIDSTTQDVTCVYAKQGANRIGYRVVDEYAGATLSGPDRRSSRQPLTLQALLEFFLGAWDLMAVLEMNFRERGYPPARVQRFVREASSDFYPGFGAAVTDHVHAWLNAKARQT